MNKVDISKLDGPIAIFWTGGWDSTYRMVELSMQNVDIQPIYILDEKRKSNERELSAIASITNLLKEKPKTVARILPLIIINVKDIPEDKKISDAVQQFVSEVGLGIQHDWTARVAKKYPGIEMCIEKAIRGDMPVRNIIHKYGKLKMSAHGYMIENTQSSEAVNLVFGNIVLPIFETTENEMLENIRAWNYEDVMAHIWFCHTPINGEPCGLCGPCHTKMANNMAFLLPKQAQEKCKTMERIEERFGERAGNMYRKIIRKINRKEVM